MRKGPAGAGPWQVDVRQRWSCEPASRRGAPTASPSPPMTTSASYRAPFAPGGPAGIDAALCERLLSVALAKGGDYADLFFEYRAGGGFVFDEGILKSASRGVSVGL